MGKKHARKKVTWARQNKFLHSVKIFRGDATLTLILAIVVIAGVFFVGGAMPRMSPDTTDQSSEAIIDEDPLSSSTNEKSLQLKTLKFKQCSSIVAVSMMLDRSGSMGNDGKIGKLKEATLSFTSNFADDSVIGIQSFDSDEYTEVPNITEDVPISYYRDVKSILESKVNALTPGGRTPTNAALSFAKDRLADALPRFPDRSFSFIFLSDGLPVPGSQDPRLFTPNPADEIKALGVTVFTIGIFGPADSIKGGELLKSIASSPDNYFSTPTGDELSSIYKAIGTKICNKVAK